MINVWAVGLTILFITSNILGFNLEVGYPIIKVGRAQAYFGYSVAQHRTLRTRDFGEAVILVGAPKDDNLSQTRQSPELFGVAPCQRNGRYAISVIYYIFVLRNQPLFTIALICTDRFCRIARKWPSMENAPP